MQHYWQAYVLRDCSSFLRPRESNDNEAGAADPHPERVREVADVEVDNLDASNDDASMIRDVEAASADIDVQHKAMQSLEAVFNIATDERIRSTIAFNDLCEVISAYNSREEELLKRRTHGCSLVRADAYAEIDR